MVRSSSTPASTVVIVISPGSGTAVRFGVSIAQFNAIVVLVVKLLRVVVQL